MVERSIQQSCVGYQQATLPMLCCGNKEAHQQWHVYMGWDTASQQHKSSVPHPFAAQAVGILQKPQVQTQALAHPLWKGACANVACSESKAVT